MKKHFFWIVPIVLYLFVVFLNGSTSYFNRTWFNVKHAIYFGLIIYVLLVTLFFVFRFFIRRYDNKKYLGKILTGILLTLSIALTFTISNIQIDYIKTYEIPQLESCKHYDKYGNIIYDSIIESCSELTNVVRTQDSLSFKVIETFDGTLTESMSVEEGIGIRYINADVITDVEVEITYNGTYIETYQITVFELTRYTDSEKMTMFKYQQLMEVDYSMENEVSVTYTSKSDFDEDYKVVSYRGFEGIEESQRKVISTFTPDESFPRPKGAIEMKEITYSDDTTLENTFIKGTFDTINEPVFDFDFYEDDEHIGKETLYSFSYNQFSVKSSIEKPVQSGVEKQYETRTVTFEPGNAMYHEKYDEYLDVLLFSTFRLEGGLLNNGVFDMNHKLVEINDELYLQDDDYYQKLVFTDYGVKIDKYGVNEFRLLDIFDKEQSSPLNYTTRIRVLDTLTRIESSANAYDYDLLIEVPGKLTQYHFYQSNPLVEHFIRDNYHKFE